MIIKKIKAQNYKTYLNLDLDLNVDDERPIILIGGENGGGKTTLFEAIYGALYGLEIHSAQDFRELLNAGVSDEQNGSIYLELQFSGKVLNEEKDYILRRTYKLNSDKKAVESVRFNMSGNIFTYGTATPLKERAESEAQVNKIIKANLPQELSRYFLFDAMEAGNLLKKDQLRKVIKENIENVMGFNKYISLSKASESLYEDYTAQRIERENLKEDYLNYISQKKELEKKENLLKENLESSLDYSIKNKDLYQAAKNGLNNEITLKNKIEQAKAELASIKAREATFRNEIDIFSRNIEQHIGLPHLVESLKSQISLILKEQGEKEYSNKHHLSKELINEIADNLVLLLERKGVTKEQVSTNELKDFFKNFNSSIEKYEYDFFEKAELQSLSTLINSSYSNPFISLYQQKTELGIALKNMSKLEHEILEYEKQLGASDFDIVQKYELNEQQIKKRESDIEENKLALSKIEKQIASFDIQNDEEPDPKYEALRKLKPFFEDLANKLLISKKQRIELKMKKDLNINLAAYTNVIDRVELSEDLKDLSFRIFHTSGNEIYLNQLNTASKQVVIQVLLKSLHEFGDYDPPVMIDTVMGVLDEQSRETVLENYFPHLSHQTLLLSTDTEIRKKIDLKKIEPFISKAYTLVRNKELQKTEIENGYFGYLIEN